MILVYKAYLYRSYVSQTEDCRPGCSAAVLQCCRGELHTLHCHDAAAVTTCHVSHVSTYPMVAGAGHRSGHAEKLQLWRILSGGLTLSRAAVTCAACGQQVTCHVSPWRGWGSITVTSSPPLLLAHVVTGGSLLPVQWSVVTTSYSLTAGGEAGTGQLSVSLCAGWLAAPLRRWCWLLV